MFESIYGHENQKKMLSLAIDKNKVTHAYLFYGPDGIGKKLIAQEFAKKILNTENLDTCVDYKYIDKKDDKKDIVVEQIRESITQDVCERPISSDKKVYVINDAHLLNEASQNALLKTLEEPPKYIVIIMIASSISSILPTIMSRVNKVKFDSIDKCNINRYLKENNIVIEDKVVDFIDGSIGKLNQIIDEGYMEEFLKIDKLACYISKKNISKLLLDAEDVDFNKSICLDYLEYCLFLDKLYLSSLEIKDAKKSLKNNGNYDIVIDNMLLRCVERV